MLSFFCRHAPVERTSAGSMRDRFLHRSVNRAAVALSGRDTSACELSGAEGGATSFSSVGRTAP